MWHKDDSGLVCGVGRPLARCLCCFIMQGSFSVRGEPVPVLRTPGAQQPRCPPSLVWRVSCRLCPAQRGSRAAAGEPSVFVDRLLCVAHHRR
jgi:hypothetical protein